MTYPDGVTPGEYIRQRYNVPAKIGSRVDYDGKPGTITGFSGARIIVDLTGGDSGLRLQPTNVTYLES